VDHTEEELEYALQSLKHASFDFDQVKDDETQTLETDMAIDN
jgi:hypothetical protein